MSIHSFCLSTCINTFERISRFVIFLKIHLSQLSDQQNFFSWPMTLYYYAILESSSSNWRRSIRERKLWICQHQWMEFWSCTFSLFSTLWRSIFFLVSNSTLVFFMSEILRRRRTIDVSFQTQFLPKIETRAKYVSRLFWCLPVFPHLVNFTRNFHDSSDCNFPRFSIFPSKESRKQINARPLKTGNSR